jgi:hypothetical protein
MVRIFRHHITKAIIIVCVVAMMFGFVSWGMTQLPTRYWNVDTDTLRPNGIVSRGVDYDDRAERVDITIEYTTDGEFDVWLVDSSEWNMSYAFSGPGPWLRHGVAGDDAVEWTVSANEFEGELRLVEENSWYGERGSLFNGTTVSYDWQVTTVSIVNPMENIATWIMIAFLVVAVVLLAWEFSLPNEVRRTFSDLYPDFPESMKTAEVDPDGK